MHARRAGREVPGLEVSGPPGASTGGWLAGRLDLGRVAVAGENRKGEGVRVGGGAVLLGGGGPCSPLPVT